MFVTWENEKNAEHVQDPCKNVQQVEISRRVCNKKKMQLASIKLWCDDKNKKNEW